MHAYRSHTCGALRAADTGHTVRLSGWIHRKRDHGGLVFIDLRDHYGLTQLVLAPDTPGFAVVERLRALGAVSVRTMPGDRETVHFPLPMGLGDKSMNQPG